MRAGLVEADGLARGRTDRTGDVRDEELTGPLRARRPGVQRRPAAHHAREPVRGAGLRPARPRPPRRPTASEREVALHRPPRRARRRLRAAGHRLARAGRRRLLPRHPGRARWACVRRRVLRCKGSDVVGVEDDLMVAEAPDDIVVVGDGALMAALTRSRGTQMRDIVATIQRHQDEAIRAQARGRHRDHRRTRHRQDRRRPAPRRLPPLLRPAPVRVRRHPRRRAPRRPTRHTSSGCCPRWARSR